MRSFNSEARFSGQRGYTIAEMLVSLTIGMIVTSLTLSSSVVNRYTISRDLVRTRLNQNLRGSLDLIGLDVRVAGENLTNSFPAIEIVNASGANSDKLFLRRNLLEEVLPLCTSIAAGSATTTLIVAQTTATPGCSYSGQTHNYTTWESYRTSNGGSVNAFIFDTANKHGEFFTYQSGVATGSQYRLIAAPRTWQYGYTAGTTAIYILEEWEYRRENDLIKLVANRNEALPYDVTFGVTDVQFSALLNDATTVIAFDKTKDWTTIASVEILITGQEKFSGKMTTRTVTGKFFPRNVLSN